MIITHEKDFTEVYKTNLWGGSGGGSLPQNTVEYRAFLQNLLKSNPIKTVNDFGCGDWCFSHLIDWSGIKYTGYDCVKTVIDKNKEAYNNYNFEHIANTEAFFTLNADLLIVKDVFQHWSNEDVVYFLKNIISNYKYILVTNHSPQKEDWENSPNPIVAVRPLSAQFEPLKGFGFKPVLNYMEQEVSLLSR